MSRLVRHPLPRRQSSGLSSRTPAPPPGGTAGRRSRGGRGRPPPSATRTADVAVLFETEDVVAIEKPPGIPYGTLDGRPGIIELLNTGDAPPLGRVYGCARACPSVSSRR